MDEDASARMLATRVQLGAPSARCLLVAGARQGPDLSGVIQSLSAGLQAAGHGVTVKNVRDDAQVPAEPARAVEPEKAYTILSGSGILDDPNTLRAASSADAVLLAVRRGATTRGDLEACRLQLDSVGATLLGAVLLN